MNKLGSLFLAAALAITAGCGQSTVIDNSLQEEATQSTDNRIQLVDFSGREIVLDEVPQSIVALSSGEMDIIYALGGTLSGRPTINGELPVKEAADVEQVGNTHNIDLEKVAFVHADVVLGNNPLNVKDIASVEGLGAQMVLTSANSVDDIKRQIQLFGQLLQKEQKAEEWIRSIDDTLNSIPQYEEKPKVLLVYGAPGTYMAALPNSLSGNILELAGGENIASSYPSLQNYPQYAQLNSERIIEANPQYIFLITHGEAEQIKDGFLKEMEQNPSWNDLDAVKNNQVEILPPDLFGTNPGTRIGEAIYWMQEFLHHQE